MIPFSYSDALDARLLAEGCAAEVSLFLSLLLGKMGVIRLNKWQVLLWMKPGENPFRQIQTH